MDYPGLEKMSHVVASTSVQQYCLFQPSLSMPVLDTTASDGPKATAGFSSDEMNGNRALKKGSSSFLGTYDRAVDYDSATPSTSPSRSPSPLPSPCVQRTLLDKPLEELTEEDIMHLTREDCRRYLKEKGMRRPSWNKSQAIQQVLSLKGLFDKKDDNEESLQTSFLKKLTEESPDPQEVPDVRQTTQAPHVATVHQCLSTSHVEKEVPQEVVAILDGFLQRHSKIDLRTMHQRGGSHQLGCPITPGLSNGDDFPRNMGTHMHPVDNATSIPLHQYKKRNLASQETCSQCMQTRSVLEMESSAPLTIFYSGMVNVYDNVPADKAKAVMLLAARSNNLKPSLCSHLQSLSSIPVTKSLDNTTISWPMPQYDHSTFATTEVPLTTVCSSVPVPVSPEPELRPSRKACLQRYLEKRRGRYNVRAPYPTFGKGAECDGSN